MNKVKGFRTMAGYNQKEISKLLNMSEGTYRKKEKGKSPFKDYEIKKFISILLEKGIEADVQDIFFEI